MAKLPYKVLVAAPLGKWEDYGRLERWFEVKYGKTVLSDNGKPYTEEELIELCKGVDGIIASARDPFTEKVLRSASSLKCIALRNVGFDNVNVKAANELGILITNAPSQHTIRNVAEHTVAMMLALGKKLNISRSFIKQGVGRWDERFDPTYFGSGATIGLVGFGRIAEQVARLLKPFRVNLLCYTRSESSKKRARRTGVKPTSLEDLLQKSDFISIHTPLTNETRHLIGKKELYLMKPTAYLVNTARGAVVDEQALIEALKEKRIAGAALDVIETNLHSAHPLLEMDHVIITPHVAGRSFWSSSHMTRIAIDGCIKMLRGIVPKNVLNPEVIPKWQKKLK